MTLRTATAEAVHRVQPAPVEPPDPNPMIGRRAGSPLQPGKTRPDTPENFSKGRARGRRGAAGGRRRAAERDQPLAARPEPPRPPLGAGDRPLSRSVFGDLRARRSSSRLTTWSWPVYVSASSDPVRCPSPTRSPPRSWSGRPPRGRTSIPFDALRFSWLLGRCLGLPRLQFRRDQYFGGFLDVTTMLDEQDKGKRKGEAHDAEAGRHRDKCAFLRSDRAPRPAADVGQSRSAPLSRFGRAVHPGLRGPSSPATSRRGYMPGMVGMASAT